MGEPIEADRIESVGPETFPRERQLLSSTAHMQVSGRLRSWPKAVEVPDEKYKSPMTHVRR